MSLPPFDHVTAASLDEAVATKARHPGAAVVAGGTDLLGTLKDRIHRQTPDLLIDLKRISGLRSIEESDDALRIGALVTLADLAAHQTVRERYPLLAEAARSVGSPQIRNMGTLGGNICQEPRCWYYRAPNDTFHCLRKGGTSCPAFFGDNRFHSIFGAARILETPCETNCPNHTAVPLLMAAVREGDLRRAAEVLLAVNPMPAITGRVCPHACEEGCNRAQFDAAVSVRDVERFVGDHVLDHAEELYLPPEVETERRVAVVGAGPAGLTAAYFLRRLGHRVTVLDEMPEPGGMLVSAIPGYRLPKGVVTRQVRALERMGIRIEPGAAVGHGDRTLESLRREHDAVFLATGAGLTKTLGLEHEELLTSGLAFLREVKRRGSAPVGRDVLVIGGGSVAVDVAITARRLGARTVTMACLESREEMPAIREDVEQALAEGIEIMASWGPERVLLEDGSLRGLRLVRCTSVTDAQGRFRPEFDPAVRRDVEADQVFLAIGQSAALDYAHGSLATAGGLLSVEEGVFSTSSPGVFAGGDVASGPATVVQAIAAGRQAAGAMHRYLVPDAVDEPAAQPAVGSPVRFDAAAVVEGGRAEAPAVPAQQRIDRRRGPGDTDGHAGAGRSDTLFRLRVRGGQCVGRRRGAARARGGDQHDQAHHRGRGVLRGPSDEDHGPRGRRARDGHRHPEAQPAEPPALPEVPAPERHRLPDRERGLPAGHGWRSRRAGVHRARRGRSGPEKGHGGRVLPRGQAPGRGDGRGGVRYRGEGRPDPRWQRVQGPCRAGTAQAGAPRRSSASRGSGVEP